MWLVSAEAAAGDLADYICYGVVTVHRPGNLTERQLSDFLYGRTRPKGDNLPVMAGLLTVTSSARVDGGRSLMWLTFLGEPLLALDHLPRQLDEDVVCIEGAVDGDATEFSEIDFHRSRPVSDIWKP